MAQQTAVDWLIKKLESQYIKTSGAYDVKIIIGINDIAEAKAMEKEQMKKAYYRDAIQRPIGVFTPLTPIFYPFEQYYNETYESNNRI